MGYIYLRAKKAKDDEILNNVCLDETDSLRIIKCKANPLQVTAVD